MTRLLETSGFLGLAVMMCVGIYQNLLVESQGAAPGWMVGGHAHLGVLSILAVVVGFSMDAFGMTGRLRTAVSGLFVVGQWALPLTLWVGLGFGLTFLMPTILLWALCLIAAMLLLAWQAATADSTVGSGPGAVAPADD